MQGDLEETVGVAGQRIPRRLWEAEIVLRCAAWVAGIHGATLLGMGILWKHPLRGTPYLPMRVEHLLAAAAMLGASALILHRRERRAIFLAVALHLLYLLYRLALVISALRATVGTLDAGGREMFLWGVLTMWGLPGVLDILLPVFIAFAVLGRTAKEPFSPALRGMPLAPLSSCLRTGASARAWGALGVVVLSLVFVAQLLFLRLA